MKRRQFLIGMLGVLIMLACSLGGLYTLMPKMGYCFGVALSEEGDRLLVAAGYKGLHMFEIVEDEALKLRTTVYQGGYYRYVEPLGGIAYVANSHKGLEILDVSQDEPVTLWAQTGSRAYGIHFQLPLAYVAAEKDGLTIYNVSDPARPRILGTLSMPGRAWDVWVEGGYAFVADVDRGLVVVEVSNPEKPRFVTSLSWGSENSYAEIIDGQNGVVYIASGEHGLMVVDVQAPTEPKISFHYDPGPSSFGEGVKVWGDTLYVTIEDGFQPGVNGLHVFDLDDPAQPLWIRTIAIADFVEDIAAGGSHLAVANTQSGVLLFDISTPQDPVLLASYPSAFWRFWISRLRW